MIRIPFTQQKRSVYNTVYDFEKLSNPDESRAAPGTVRSELQVSIALGPFWSTDMSRPYLPFISATDASTTFGFGVSVANASEKLVREVSSYAEKRGGYVVLENANAPGRTKPTKPRQGTPRCLKLDTADFKTILSIKARHAAHSNILEAEAYLIWLRWLLRSTSHHAARAVCLVDSKVVLGGVTKGRSSSQPLLRVLRRAAALQIAGNLLVRLVYIPTEWNAADAPSRGVRQRPVSRAARNKFHNTKVQSKKRRYHQRLANVIRRSPYSAELADLVADDPSFWRFQYSGTKRSRPP